MQLIPTAEQEELRQAIRRLLLESSHRSDVDLWQRMTAQGHVGLAIPEQFGGGGFGYSDLAVVFEEAGRALCGVPLLPASMAAELLIRSGDDGAMRDYLPGIASGTVIVTAAPPVSCRDLRVQTTASRAGTSWLVSGTQRLAVAADTADVHLVPAHTANGLTLFAVPYDGERVRRTAVSGLDQTRAVTDLAFRQARAGLIGTEAGAAPALEHALRVSTVLLAAEQVGGMARVLEMAVEYAKTRTQFGRPIGSFQAVAHKCADMLAALELARAAAAYAAWALDSGAADLPIAVDVAKVVCSEAYKKIAAANIQVHGGIGFTLEHPAHRFLKRAYADDALLGSPAEHRAGLADLIAL